MKILFRFRLLGTNVSMSRSSVFSGKSRPFCSKNSTNCRASFASIHGNKYICEWLRGMDYSHTG